MGENVSSIRNGDLKYGIAQPEFEELVEFLKLNKFNVVIVEGPRGSGKTTFCTRLLSSMDLVYYKTWGGNQSDVRNMMQQELSLDLPQGTYFVLDFVRQVETKIPVLADRGNLSAMAYQRELPWGSNNKLHEYYVDLMEQSGAVLLTLTASVDEILRRRINRAEQDEFRLHRLDEKSARSWVTHDCEIYEESTDRMVRAGLREVESFDIGGGTTCWVFAPKGVEILHSTEKS